MKNQRGDPWKSKFFLLRGVNERGWRGSEAFYNPPPAAFLINKKLKFKNVPTDSYIKCQSYIKLAVRDRRRRVAVHSLSYWVGDFVEERVADRRQRACQKLPLRRENQKFDFFRGSTILVRSKKFINNCTKSNEVHQMQSIKCTKSNEILKIDLRKCKE